MNEYIYIYILSSLDLHHLEDNVTPFNSDKKTFNATGRNIELQQICRVVQSQGLVSRPTFIDSGFSNDSVYLYSLDMAEQLT